MAYADIAPIANSLGIQQSAAVVYFDAIPAPTAPQPDPVMTKEKYIAVADCVYVESIEANNGVRGIAAKVNLTVQQVNEVIAELYAQKAVYDAANTPEE